MRFRFPGTDVHVRLFEKVETSDKQYEIVECGVEYKNGGVDSLVTGGSFYSATQAIKKINAVSDQKSAEKAIEEPVVA